MLRRAWLAAKLPRLGSIAGSPAAGIMGQTECITLRPCARPNSFDGCRLAALAAQQDGCKERVAGQQLPRLQLEEAQTSLRDTPDRPFVLEGAMHAWTMRGLNFDQLKQQYGHVQVPVEQSRGGGDYRDLYQPRSFSATPRSFAADVLVPLGDLLDHVQHHQDDRHGATMCMAQHDLFQVIPELEAHIQPPPFQEAVERLYKRNAWIGPAGCSTPLHRDPYRNALCQIKGSKHIELFHSDWCQQIYPFTTMVLRNTSQVDVNAPDPESFPLFMRVPYSECTLNEGDILYIPRRWWHFVRAETPSISVNYWWTVPS